jgi:hypothetical protein
MKLASVVLLVSILTSLSAFAKSETDAKALGAWSSLGDSIRLLQQAQSAKSVKTQCKLIERAVNQSAKADKELQAVAKQNNAVVPDRFLEFRANLIDLAMDCDSVTNASEFAGDHPAMIRRLQMNYDEVDHAVQAIQQKPADPAGVAKVSDLAPFQANSR